MSSLIKLKEIRKATTKDLVDTMKKISEIIELRANSEESYDQEGIMRDFLGEKCFENGDLIVEPFKVSDALICVPSLMPPKDSNGNRKNNAKSVLPIIQLPGGRPYLAYDESSDTFVDQQTYSLRGGRSVTLHRVIPGMLVSLHHFRTENGRAERSSIDVCKMMYDDYDELYFEKMPESYGFIDIPTIASRPMDI